MASLLSLTHPPATRSHSQPLFRTPTPPAALTSDLIRSSGDLRVVGVAVGKRKTEKARVWEVRAGLDTTVPVIGQVTEVNKDTFWPLAAAAGDMTVVLDMYTQWCGPCKLMAPKFQELSKKYRDVVFLKLDCNQENKVLAKELGIRVVPTFKILKNCKIIREVKGAKLEDLVVAIEAVRSS